VNDAKRTNNVECDGVCIEWSVPCRNEVPCGR
jgi:hypothetical protein